MSTILSRIAEKAKTDHNVRFTSLAHLLTPEFLLETWKQMNRRGASGVDGETTKEFEQGLETRVQQLHERLKAKQYRPPPVRRVEIPKGNGKTRPLGIPTVEDRLVQRAVARILSAIFEEDFLECSQVGPPPRGFTHPPRKDTNFRRGDSARQTRGLSKRLNDPKRRHRAINPRTIGIVGRVIASTATVRRASDQIRAIFGRSRTDVVLERCRSRTKADLLSPLLQCSPRACVAGLFPPAEVAGGPPPAQAEFANFGWQSHCRDLFRLPVAA